MKFKNKFLLLILVFFTYACEGRGQVVKFQDFYSYAEVSLEQESYLVFRALLAPKSYMVITRHSFHRNESPEIRKYYLYFIEEPGNKKPVGNIEYCDWGGIKLTVPRGSFDPEADEIFYKDSLGEYKIDVGTKKTWMKHLRQKGLKDIDPDKI